MEVLTVLAAFFTSALSAVLGMAGGITLLAVMMTTLDYALIIPLHGLTQLASNASRTWFFRKSVDRTIFLQYALFMFPAAGLGMLLVGHLDPLLLKAFTAAFILYALYTPQMTMFEKFKGSARFRAAGVFSGVIGMIAGATGPLIAPFFLNAGLVKNAIIGTKAACQISMHFTKVLLYGSYLSFPYMEFIPLAIGLCASALLGTWFGKTVLSKKLSEGGFLRLYRGVLTLIALKILFWDVLRELILPLA